MGVEVEEPASWVRAWSGPQAGPASSARAGPASWGPVGPPSWVRALPGPRAGPASWGPRAGPAWSGSAEPASWRGRGLHRGGRRGLDRGSRGRSLHRRGRRGLHRRRGRGLHRGGRRGLHRGRRGRGRSGKCTMTVRSCRVSCVLGGEACRSHTGRTEGRTGGAGSGIDGGRWRGLGLGLGLGIGRIRAGGRKGDASFGLRGRNGYRLGTGSDRGRLDRDSRALVTDQPRRQGLVEVGGLSRRNGVTREQEADGLATGGQLHDGGFAAVGQLDLLPAGRRVECRPDEQALDLRLGTLHGHSGRGEQQADPLGRLRAPLGVAGQRDAG